uniref:Secreted protein n=1 Tax=Steinernema glaseri TaxID=37863 RepID=A0A1I8ATB5_9BILA
MHQPGVLLAVEVVHLCVVVAQRQVAALDTGIAHLVVARGVAQVLFFQAAHVQGQAVDVLRGQQAAVVGRGQQAHVVDRGNRQGGLQGAELEHALAQAQLGGQAQFAVVVRRLLAGAERQQAGAPARLAGVEIQAQLAQRIQANTQGAFGVTRFHAQDEALGPLPRLALGRGVLAKVAAEIEVAGLQAGLAVLD